MRNSGTNRRYFHEKVVLLTGAASGLGRQVALELAARGAHLILVDIDEEGLRGVRETMRTLGVNVHTHVVDVADGQGMAVMRAELPEGFRDVELVISNAGIAGMTFGDEISGAAARRIMEVNYLGLVNLVELFLPAMRVKGRGHFVAISSLAGLRGLPLGGYYAASKAAQILFLDCLRIDLHGSGIKVSTIQPGLIDTGINHEIKQVFKLPRMMKATSAAESILRAVAKGRRLHVFPFNAKVLAWVDRLLPDFLRDPLLALPIFWRGKVIRTRAELPRSPAGTAPGARPDTSAREKRKPSDAA